MLSPCACDGMQVTGVDWRVELRAQERPGYPAMLDAACLPPIPTARCLQVFKRPLHPFYPPSVQLASPRFQGPILRCAGLLGGAGPHRPLVQRCNAAFEHVLSPQFCSMLHMYMRGPAFSPARASGSAHTLTCTCIWECQHSHPPHPPSLSLSVQRGGLAPHVFCQGVGPHALGPRGAAAAQDIPGGGRNKGPGTVCGMPRRLAGLGCARAQ